MQIYVSYGLFLLTSACFQHYQIKPPGRTSPLEDILINLSGRMGLEQIIVLACRRFFSGQYMHLRDQQKLKTSSLKVHSFRLIGRMACHAAVRNSAASCLTGISLPLESLTTKLPFQEDFLGRFSGQIKQGTTSLGTTVQTFFYPGS